MICEYESKPVYTGTKYSSIISESALGCETHPACSQPTYYITIINNSNIISSSPVFRSDLVVWGYCDPAMSSLFLHVI